MSTESRTAPEVFIIESLHKDDEEIERSDGKTLKSILQLLPERLPRYYYFRTKRELKEMAELFRESNCRYLHLSCHGSVNGLQLRLGKVSFADFAEIFSEVLNDRRIFVSACEVGVKAFADEIFRTNPKCYSVVAPSHSPGITESAIYWSAFYYLMHKRNPKVMKRAPVKETLVALGAIFPPEMQFFGPPKKTATKKL